jgi:predicted RecA/RadA family phage recombinase
VPEVDSYFENHTMKLGGIKVGAVEQTATILEVNRAADVSGRLVLAGSTLAVTEALHDGKTILLDQLAGSVCTLPAATGSGARFRFRVYILATSVSHIVKVTGTDIIQGIVNTIDTDTAGTTTGFATAADSDTITLNRGTTGSAMRGEWLELEDVASGLWLVRGQLANTSSGATPFSAAVP